MANFENVFLVIQLIVAISIVILVLLQRSEGGGLGIGGGGGAGGMMSARGAANLLTKVTKWMVIIFIVNSLLLGNISFNRNKGQTALDVAEEIQTLPEKESPKQPPLPSKEDGDN